MKQSIARAAVAAALSGMVLTGFAAPAFADPVVVDEPDTGDLENPWTFAPGGVPVNGVIKSVENALKGFLPK
ncbi:hypothetical protein FKR81_42190 [Lentzea tibetensis]|uniref:Uncharacterized protein n=1 Tax=Lentzea tibetensis TaxID=2591470 RepID=A0A563EEQ8_9PSEU|nr:hypothetical protein [Lentzea tibetensis]TWP43640.1 hypothetical protein FKR81_42190 [Lentzea tibetensis]